MPTLSYIQQFIKGQFWVKFLLIMIGFMLITFITKVYFGAKYQSVIIQNRELGVKIANSLDFYIHGRMIMLHLLAEDQKLRSLDVKIIRPELEKITAIFGFVNIAVFDTEGNLIVDAKSVHPARAFTDDSFEKATGGVSAISHRIMRDDDSSPRVALRIPVYDDFHKVIAVITAVIPSEELTRLVENQIGAGRRYVFIVNDKYEFIYHPNLQNMIDQEALFTKELIKLYHSPTSSLVEVSPFDGILKTFVIVPLEKTNWRIFVTLSFYDVWCAIMKNASNEIFIFILILVCFMLFHKVLYQTKRHNEDIELLKVERLTSVNQLAAGIAHEIRNPLTSIKGFIQLIAQKKDQPVPKEYIDVVLEEIARIEKLICEFQKLARPVKPLSFDILNLNNVLNNVILLMESQALSKSIALSFIQENNNLMILGDEDQLKQVWINILRNAIEAVPEGGTIQVVAAHVFEHAVVTITDNGTGIPAGVLNKIGTPFFTTKDSGTGLGLSVCYNLIQNHDGKIEINSKEGEGTNVIVTLPLVLS